jgi:hypothetical protein
VRFAQSKQRFIVLGLSTLLGGQSVSRWSAIDAIGPVVPARSTEPHVRIPCDSAAPFPPTTAVAEPSLPTERQILVGTAVSPSATRCSPAASAATSARTACKAHRSRAVRRACRRRPSRRSRSRCQRGHSAAQRVSVHVTEAASRSRPAGYFALQSWMQASPVQGAWQDLRRKQPWSVSQASDSARHFAFAHALHASGTEVHTPVQR